MLKTRLIKTQTNDIDSNNNDNNTCGYIYIHCQCKTILNAPVSILINPGPHALLTNHS